VLVIVKVFVCVDVGGIGVFVEVEVFVRVFEAVYVNVAVGGMGVLVTV